jgi:hypothetical protein
MKASRSPHESTGFGLAVLLAVLSGFGCYASLRTDVTVSHRDNEDNRQKIAEVDASSLRRHNEQEVEIQELKVDSKAHDKSISDLSAKLDVMLTIVKRIDEKVGKGFYVYFLVVNPECFTGPSRMGNCPDLRRARRLHGLPLERPDSRNLHADPFSFICGRCDLLSDSRISEGFFQFEHWWLSELCRRQPVSVSGRWITDAATGTCQRIIRRPVDVAEVFGCDAIAHADHYDASSRCDGDHRNRWGEVQLHRISMEQGGLI